MKILALVGFLFVIGCAQIAVGPELDKTKLDQVVKGKTSKEEVLKIFGEPAEKVTEAGLERWIYTNRVTSAAPRAEWFRLAYHGDVQEKKLVILFEENTVKDVSFSESSRPFESRLGLN